MIQVEVLVPPTINAVNPKVEVILLNNYHSFINPISRWEEKKLLSVTSSFFKITTWNLVTLIIFEFWIKVNSGTMPNFRSLQSNKKLLVIFPFFLSLNNFLKSILFNSHKIFLKKSLFVAFIAKKKHFFSHFCQFRPTLDVCLSFVLMGGEVSPPPPQCEIGIIKTTSTKVYWFFISFEYL